MSKKDIEQVKEYRAKLRCKAKSKNDCAVVKELWRATLRLEK